MACLTARNRRQEGHFISVANWGRSFGRFAIYPYFAMRDHSVERFAKVAGGTVDGFANRGRRARPRSGPGRLTSLSEEQHRGHAFTLVVRVC
jgi:hypothetical protein